VEDITLGTEREERWHCRYREKINKNKMIKKCRKLRKSKKCFLHGFSEVKSYRVLWESHLHWLVSGAKTPEISWEKRIFSQIGWSRWQRTAILTMGEDQKRGFLRF
jgi:hypothetical protein